MLLDSCAAADLTRTATGPMLLMISHSGEDGNGTIWCITYQAATAAIDRGLNPSGDWPLLVRLYRPFRSDSEAVSLGSAPLSRWRRQFSIWCYAPCPTAAALRRSRLRTQPSKTQLREEICRKRRSCSTLIS